jgi:hypothetical protein
LALHYFQSCKEVGTAQPVYWLGYGLHNQAITIWFLAGLMDFLLLQTIQTRSGANSAFCSSGTVGSSPETRAASVQLITDLHLAIRYRMNTAISPLPHMPSWCAQGQMYVYFFTFADLWPSSQFQFRISSQFTTADLILKCHCIQMRLSFMQFCESGQYILLRCCSLTTHGIWHGQALTGDSQKSVQSLSIVDPPCGPQFLRQFSSDLTL